MGMPVTIEMMDVDSNRIFNKIFDYFFEVDGKFSTYKFESEISAINRGELKKENFSREMKEIFGLANSTKNDTLGFFDIKRDGVIDPSGIVKGWAIYNASKLLKDEGILNFYIDAGGDIEVSGLKNRKKWKVGVRNPFKKDEVVKVFGLTNAGIATSGNYERGDHVYNPHAKHSIADIASITVIGPNVYEADRFATAAYAMGSSGIDFIEKQRNLEGYMIDNAGIATYTSGIGKYLV